MDMFAVEPNAQVMKKVTGFLYGSEVPVETAADCYIACRGQQYSREALYSWNDIWDTHRRHNVDYWNMRSKRLVVELERIGRRRDIGDGGDGDGDWIGADQEDLSRMVVGVKLCHRVH
jgi:hypothetical protein